MRIQGYFNNIDNSKTYWIQIGKEIPGQSGDIQYIKDSSDNLDGNTICWSNDPITITSNMSDTFENVYIRSCEINLVSNFDIRPYVLAENIYDLPVEIHYDDSEGDIIFSGYVIPLSFNQPFAVEWNEFTLNCVDKLGLLEYIKFRPYINSLNYDTPRSFINKIIGVGEGNYPITFSYRQYNIEYDHTNDTQINPQIFIGESEDDWMTCKEVLEEIGKIYGCYFYQNGDTCVIENILLYNLNNPVAVTQDDYLGDDTNITIQEAYNRIECTVDLSTIDETIIDPFKDEYFVPTTERAERVLSEIMVKGGGDKMTTKAECFKHFVRLATGKPGDAPDHTPVRNWYKQVGGGAPGPYYNEAVDPEVYDVYCQVYNNMSLDFGDDSYLDNGGSDTTDAWKTLKWLYDHPGKGAFLGFASTNDLINAANDAEPSLEDLKKMLLIQVNGERQQSDFNDTDTLFSDQITSQDNYPVCTFELQTSNNFVPNDKNTTNYLLFSGSITLNPITPRVCFTDYEKDNIPLGVSLHDWMASYGDSYTDYWLGWRMAQCPTNALADYINDTWSQGVVAYMLSYDSALYKRFTKEKPSDDDGYYLQYYGWDNITPGWDPETGEIVPDPPYNQNPNFERKIALPYLKPKFKKLLYSGSSFQKRKGSALKIDKVNYVAVLACELTIGEGANMKYLIEDFSVRENNIWSITYNKYKNLYKWCTYDECPDIGDGRKQTWFTLGINPSTDKSILGEEWKIAKNVSIEMNIGDKDGTAIPIYSDSGLVGPVNFKILGPYNSTWDHTYAVKHGAWFWKHFSTESENVSILAFTENIQISEFKIELVTNKQDSDANDDKDLVYYSHESNTYQEKTSYECKFCTSLTSDDVRRLGINYKPNNSAIMYMNPTTGSLEAWTGMTYKGTTDVKLEEARVAEHYNIWKRPRSIVETTLRLVEPEKAYLKTNYMFNYLKYDNNQNHIYRALNREIDLKYDTMLCTMKELSDKNTN